MSVKAKNIAGAKQVNSCPKCGYVEKNKIEFKPMTKEEILEMDRKVKEAGTGYNCWCGLLFKTYDEWNGHCHKTYPLIKLEKGETPL